MKISAAVLVSACRSGLEEPISLQLVELVFECLWYLGEGSLKLDVFLADVILSGRFDVGKSKSLFFFAGPLTRRLCHDSTFMFLGQYDAHGTL